MSLGLCHNICYFCNLHNTFHYLFWCENILRALTYSCHIPSTCLVGESVLDNVTMIIFLSINSINHVCSIQQYDNIY
jgi:hypothetical protein